MKSSASLIEAVWVALGSLRASKLRSFLTLLGIILATTTLIAVMSVIHGMDVYIAGTISDMGVDGFRVQRTPRMGQFDPKKWIEMNRRNPQLTLEEFRFLESHVTFTNAMGIQSGRSTTINCGSQQIEDSRLNGASPNIGVITNTRTSMGRFFTENDDRRRLMVAFIGEDIRETCFPSVNPIGKTVTLSGRPFEVIGVAREQGTIFGQSRDNFVMIPIQTYFKLFGARQGMSYAAKAANPNLMYQAQEEVRMLLRAYRHLRPDQEDTFGLFSSDTMLAQWNQITGAIAATAIGVVSVFMVVGGVVIMNIMLAVVSERTHEIGIRKSVGARQRDIMNQFLVESSVLAASGGLAGVLSAWIIAVLVRTLTPVPTSVPIYAVAIGVGLSTAVGLFFGMYPARTAAKLDPIEALRAEK